VSPTSSSRGHVHFARHGRCRPAPGGEHGWSGGTRRSGFHNVALRSGRTFLGNRQIHHQRPPRSRMVEASSRALRSSALRGPSIFAVRRTHGGRDRGFAARSATTAQQSGSETTLRGCRRHLLGPARG
jgi:hypothetical protein